MRRPGDTVLDTASEIASHSASLASTAMEKSSTVAAAGGETTANVAAIVGLTVNHAGTSLVEGTIAVGCNLAAGTLELASTAVEFVVSQTGGFVVDTTVSVVVNCGRGSRFGNHGCGRRVNGGCRGQQSLAG